MLLSNEELEEMVRNAFASVTIGAGTCDRAKFLILLGYAHEQKILVERRLVRPSAGRPMKAAYGGVDCFRAFTIWRVSKIIKTDAPLSNREWIGRMVELAKYGIVEEQVFPASSSGPGGTLEQSVSRGKSKMKISEDWSESVVCEKLQADFSQTT